MDRVDDRDRPGRPTLRRTRGYGPGGSWLERIWPRAAGAALAVGATYAIHENGFAPSVALTTAAGLLTSLVWFAMTPGGRPPSPGSVALLTAQASGCALTCWGLIDLLGWWALPPLALLGLGSPLLGRWWLSVHDRVVLGRLERGAGG